MARSMRTSSCQFQETAMCRGSEGGDPRSATEAGVQTAPHAPPLMSIFPQAEQSLEDTFTALLAISALAIAGICNASVCVPASKASKASILATRASMPSRIGQVCGRPSESASRRLVTFQASPSVMARLTGFALADKQIRSPKLVGSAPRALKQFERTKEMLADVQPVRAACRHEGTEHPIVESAGSHRPHSFLGQGRSNAALNNRKPAHRRAVRHAPPIPVCNLPP